MCSWSCRAGGATAAWFWLRMRPSVETLTSRLGAVSVTVTSSAYCARCSALSRSFWTARLAALATAVITSQFAASRAS